MGFSLSPTAVGVKFEHQRDWAATLPPTIRDFGPGFVHLHPKFESLQAKSDRSPIMGDDFVDRAVNNPWLISGVAG